MDETLRRWIRAKQAEIEELERQHGYHFDKLAEIGARLKSAYDALSDAYRREVADNG